MSTIPGLNTSLALSQVSQGQIAEAAEKTKSERDLAKIDAAAKDFEAVFAAEMLKPMFEGISTDGPFGGGKGEEVFRGLLLDQYGKTLAEHDSLGIAAQVKQEMLRIQEATSNAKGNAQ